MEISTKVDYDEIMKLWEYGSMTRLANYLNSRGIYSNTNKTWHVGRIGSYEWVNHKNGNMEHDLLVLGVMLFPSHLRCLKKESQNEPTRPTSSYRRTSQRDC